MRSDLSMTTIQNEFRMRTAGYIILIEQLPQNRKQNIPATCLAIVWALPALSKIAYSRIRNYSPLITGKKRCDIPSEQRNKLTVSNYLSRAAHFIHLCHE